jgi:hypothetical protein
VEADAKILHKTVAYDRPAREGPRSWPIRHKFWFRLATALGEPDLLESTFTNTEALTELCPDRGGQDLTCFADRQTSEQKATALQRYTI